jgi:hypothetical protein
MRVLRYKYYSYCLDFAMANSADLSLLPSRRQFFLLMTNKLYLFNCRRETLYVLWFQSPSVKKFCWFVSLLGLTRVIGLFRWGQRIEVTSGRKMCSLFPGPNTYFVIVESLYCHSRLRYIDFSKTTHFHRIQTYVYFLVMAIIMALTSTRIF